MAARRVCPFVRQRI